MHYSYIQNTFICPMHLFCCLTFSKIITLLPFLWWYKNSRLWWCEKKLLKLYMKRYQICMFWLKRRARVVSQSYFIHRNRNWNFFEWINFYFNTVQKYTKVLRSTENSTAGVVASLEISSLVWWKYSHWIVWWYITLPFDVIEANPKIYFMH